jgi:hypothetical protein
MKLYRTFATVTFAAALVWAATGLAHAAEVTADDTAKFLAGMQPSADLLPLMPLTKDPSWQRHARFFDNAFGQLDSASSRRSAPGRRRIGRAQADHGSTCSPGRTSLYANASIRKATTYVLAALEPPGQVPDLDQGVAGRHRLGALQCRAFAGSILSFSFFITKQMKS